MPGIPEKLSLIVEVFCNILEVFINSFIKVASHLHSLKPIPVFRIRPGQGRFHVSLTTETGGENLDARIAKIESARQSLSDALSAMDELKLRAEENKRDLEFLTAQIQRAKADKASLSGELETLKDIAALDTNLVRKVMRLPTRISIWTERVIAFVFGVISSIVASWVYDFFVKPHL